jgi:hypothetical protein
VSGAGAACRVIRVALIAAACAGSGASGCGGRAPAIAVPTRATTAGDVLLARLPPGAAIVLEVDVARLRANPAVGPLVGALVARPPAPEAAAPAALAALTDAPLAGARAIVLAAYAVGTPAASTITIVDGDGAPPQATPLAGGVYALAAEGDVARVLAVAGGGASLAADRELAALRALAMPAAAEGAAARLTARLDRPARKALADVLGTADAPPVVSAWLDVADDLALVAWVGGEPRRWAPLLERVRDRAAVVALVAALGLGPPVAAAVVRRERAAARLTLVVAPARLRRVVERARDHLSLAWPAAAPGGPGPGRVESPR